MSAPLSDLALTKILNRIVTKMQIDFRLDNERNRLDVVRQAASDVIGVRLRDYLTTELKSVDTAGLFAIIGSIDDNLHNPETEPAMPDPTDVN